MPKVALSPRKSKGKTRKATDKTAYRVRNWSEYNNGLKQRGSLTFWFDEKVIKAWPSVPILVRHSPLKN